MGTRSKKKAEEKLLLPVRPAESVCMYDQCRFCSHRINASSTPEARGQCELELRGGARMTLCRGSLFFRLAPEHAQRYRNWLRTGTIKV